MKSTGKRKVAQTTAMTIYSFFALVFIGGILLNLPISNTTETTFLDSVFTSAASVCVSGLTTVSVASQYTFIGKIIILLLMQIGALGFILIMASFYLLIKRKITYKEQIMIGETIGSEAHLENIKKLITRVIKYTFITELIRSSNL